MKKNILKKFIVLLSLGFILLGFNFVFAAPVITINGENPMDVIVEKDFIDEGATAIDEITKENITVETSGYVDVKKIGSYLITYTATDSSLVSTTATRTVNITSLPVILNSIAITTPATKLSYLVGDSLDISGLAVTGTYTDNSTKNEIFSITDVTGFNSTIVATNQVLTITVNGKTITYNVNINAVSSVSTENILIRNGDTVIYNGSIPLPSTGTIDILGQQVNKQSILGILYELDQKERSFSVSDLSYNSGYQSFLLNCITPTSSDPICYNWNYVVNNVMPDKGIDKVVLTGSESIGFFFGDSRKLISNSPVTTNDSLIVTAQKYNYLDNTWIPLTGVTVGLLIPNADPSSYTPPVVVSDNTVGADGVSSIKISDANSYSIGIKNIDPVFGDYYFPTYSVKVTDPDVGGGSVSSVPVPSKTFSISSALSFLSQNKESASIPVHDWIAIAAGSGNDVNLKSDIANYLRSNPINSLTVTDNDRRAMALMALGINPYNGTEINYIQKILDSFNGTQFYDESGSDFNDDIFALIVLKNAGYNGSDEKIAKDINYIISKQFTDGSWGSVDMTGASIQALRGFESIAGVSGAISKGESYLISNQKSDGSFENTSSTSWALQSLFTNSNILKAESYLATKQQTDGGLENIGDDINTRVWATAYAVPAILHKPWSNILNNFSKQIIENTSVSNDREEMKKEIEVPVVKIEEIKNEEIASVLITKKTDKTPLRKNEIKKNKQVKAELKIVDQNKNIGNPLSANVVGATRNNKGFLSAIHNMLNRIKAPFTWLLVKFGF